MPTTTRPALTGRPGYHGALTLRAGVPSARVEEDEEDLFGDDDIDFEDDGAVEEDDVLDDEEFDDALEE